MRGVKMLNAIVETYSTVWKGMKENQECTSGDYSFSLFNKTFLPTSNLWFLKKFSFVCLALSTSWKFSWTNSSSQSLPFISLKGIITCLHRQTLAGIAPLAKLWISVCVYLPKAVHGCACLMCLVLHTSMFYVRVNSKILNKLRYYSIHLII